MDVTDFLQLFFYGEAIPILSSVTTRMETDSVKIEFHKKPDCLVLFRFMQKLCTCLKFTKLLWKYSVRVLHVRGLRVDKIFKLH